VIKADNLRVADVFSSDPFCQLRLSGVSRTTAVRKSTINPSWHETFTFPLLSLECELLCQVRLYCVLHSKSLEVRIILKYRFFAGSAVVISAMDCAAK
jgi:Ca2+-dependent lipid-binding protein